MFTVIQVGKKQYPVKEGDVIEVDYLAKKEQASFTVKDVLLFSQGKKVEVGQPYLKDISVICEVMADKVSSKVIALKFKRRKGYIRKIGHRQKNTLVKIKEIKIG